jgi:uncharacterized protein YegL
MTAANRTHIALILDRSGSMSHIKSDMQAAMNQLISEQKSIEGDCKLTFVQFDDTSETVLAGVPIKIVGELELNPRGSTALNDAMGKTITALGDSIRHLPEQERPEKVVVVVVTDGYENASREYSAFQIKKMVSHQQEKYNWQFVFLGANQDAVLKGQEYGVSRDASMTYAPTYAGVHNFAMSTNNAITDFRLGSASSVTYSNNDRTQAMAK